MHRCFSVGWKGGATARLQLAGVEPLIATTSHDRTAPRRPHILQERRGQHLHPQPPNDNNTAYFSLHILLEWKGRDLLCRPCGQLSREGDVLEIVPVI